MLYFAEKITLPLLSRLDRCSVLEIGASKGNHTRALTARPKFEVTVIDPCVDADLAETFGARIALRKGMSLDILPLLQEHFDAIFIDGDHNWFTVFSELKAIEDGDLLAEDGIIFLHDVSWPYGRRDMYYEPDRIPPAHRQLYAQSGMIRGRSELAGDAGTNSGHFNATHEGGARNGVLTAIEDFMEQSTRKYYFFVDGREFGLGVLIRKSDRNDLRFALSVYWTIQRSTYVDPVLSSARVYGNRIWTGRGANLLRAVRNKLLRRG